AERDSQRRGGPDVELTLDLDDAHAVALGDPHVERRDERTQGRPTPDAVVPHAPRHGVDVGARRQVAGPERTLWRKHGSLLAVGPRGPPGQDPGAAAAVTSCPCKVEAERVRT